MTATPTGGEGAAPLAGIRILELCHTIMGPTAGVLLADLGADVVKVEPAAGGDPTRKLPGFAAGFFTSFNRNKRGIAIDLKSDEGRAVAHRLFAGADVVLENYGPGTMERLGCGWETLRAINPRLIFCALKGFLSGPYENRLALDEVVQFMAGLAYMTGPPGRPLRAGASVVDIMGGMFAVIGVLTALRERDVTGLGGMVKSALYESVAFLMTQHMAGEAVTGREVPPMPARLGAWGVYEPFETADGQQVFIGITSNNHWHRFCAEFERSDLLAEPRYASNEARVAARAELLPIVAGIVKRYPLAAVTATAERIGIPFAPVAKPGDLFDDPQLNAFGRMLEIDLPTGGSVKLPRIPLEVGEHDFGLRRQPPAVGEHTAEVLGEYGFAAAEIDGLAKAGVVLLGNRG